MRYAQLFVKSAISDENVEACGSDSVVILDGRSTPYRSVCEVKEHIKKANANGKAYTGFTLRKGDNFTRSHEIRSFTAV